MVMKYFVLLTVPAAISFWLVIALGMEVVRFKRAARGNERSDRTD